MEDRKIISLYHARDERAIFETDRKYGRYLKSISSGLLSAGEDAQECVNDTYLAAWQKMPPDEPRCLRVYLGRIVRNISVSFYRRAHAKKRFSGAQILFSELEEILPDASSNKETETSRITEVMAEWLKALRADDRALFLKRYWYLESVKSLSLETGMKAEKITQKLSRLRKRLRTELEKEGISV